MRLFLSLVLMLALVASAPAADLGSPVPMPRAAQVSVPMPRPTADHDGCNCAHTAKCTCDPTNCPCDWCRTPVAQADDPRVRVWLEPEPVYYQPPPLPTFTALPYAGPPQIPQAMLQAQNCRS